MNNNNKPLLKLVFSGAFLALCMVLPLLTGQIPEIGSRLSPMHIPVLLCGFICGWPYGLAVGLIAPLMRTLIFGMPPLFPVSAAMVFELGAYGLASGLLYKLLPKKLPSIYAALIVSMLVGRIVWGGAMASFALLGIRGMMFPFSAFIAGAFTNAVPGIILHIILIPPLVAALKRARLSFNE